MCLGPLTNVALCIRLDNDFHKKLKSCWIMGGNYHGKFNLITYEHKSPPTLNL